jgi:hypothetical protein
VNFGTGLGGSVVGGLYGGAGSPGSVGQAGQPAATSGPTGRPSLMAAAWGTDAGGVSNAGVFAGFISAAAWVGLIYLWWVLPR